MLSEIFHDKNYNGNNSVIILNYSQVGSLICEILHAGIIIVTHDKGDIINIFN